MKEAKAANRCRPDAIVAFFSFNYRTPMGYDTGGARIGAGFARDPLPSSAVEPSNPLPLQIPETRTFRSVIDRRTEEETAAKVPTIFRRLSRDSAVRPRERRSVTRA